VAVLATWFDPQIALVVTRFWSWSLRSIRTTVFSYG